jgi:glycosyltransferase involved in cell wall biosynthesis
VLVISHDADRQGAQMMMLHLLRWWHQRETLDFDIVLGVDGPLRSDFEGLARTVVYDPFPTMWRGFRGVFRLLPPTVRRSILKTRLRMALRGRRYDLIYSNTVANEKVLQALDWLDCRTVAHVHELEYAIRRVGPRTKLLRDHADHFIAVSGAVKDNLVVRHEIPTDRISVVHEAVSSTGAQGIDPPQRVKGAPPVVAGCGVGDPRKGIDLLPRLAGGLASNLSGRPFVIRWIGSVDPEWRDLIDLDLDRLGLADRVEFVGEVLDPRLVLADADVFVLPSREDPFPLVCLEAAQCGLPIVCFADGGGAPELVEEDAGRVVPYLDVGAMAGAVAEIVGDEKLRARLGRRAQEKVETLYSVDRQAARALELVERLISKDGRTDVAD